MAELEKVIKGLEHHKSKLKCVKGTDICPYIGHGLDRDKLIEELGDVLWYCAETAAGLGIPLEKAAMDNITKLAARYPDGFESERSVNRSQGK